jgi:hypothetical protein
MEFLKNHYEKVVLSLVLLLMAGGAVMLVLGAGSVQQELDNFKKVVVETGGQRPDPPNRGEYLSAISNAQPRLIDLTKGHKVFNPELWYVNTNGDLIIGTNVGVSKLFVTEIKPLRLKLELVISGNAERPSYLVKMTKEFMPKVTDQKPINRSISLNSTNYLDETKPVRKFNGYLVPRAISGPPDNPTVELDYHDPSRDVEKVKLTKAQPFETVVDYGAKLLYSVENIQFPSPARKDINYERKDSQLVFAGDTNIIVEITATNVVVKAISNDKPTTIPLAPPPASTPARKAP